MLYIKTNCQKLQIIYYLKLQAHSSLLVSDCLSSIRSHLSQSWKETRPTRSIFQGSLTEPSKLKRHKSLRTAPIPTAGSAAAQAEKRSARLTPTKSLQNCKGNLRTAERNQGSLTPRTGGESEEEPGVQTQAHNGQRGQALEGKELRICCFLTWGFENNSPVSLWFIIAAFPGMFLASTGISKSIAQGHTEKGNNRLLGISRCSR